MRSGEGLGAELAIWDKLLECVIAGEAAVEYGVVEDRLFERYPTEAGELLQRYGHAWRDPDHPSGRFSMSAYLAGRLSELAAEGLLVKTFGDATGPWATSGRGSSPRRPVSADSQLGEDPTRRRVSLRRWGISVSRSEEFQ